MMNSLAILAGLCLAITSGATRAEAISPKAHDHAPGKAEAYVPGLGEIMALQQMRHAKLWLAGTRGNWDLANYELDELREGFDDASKLHPVHGSVPVAAVVAKLTPAPLESIGKAIKERSPAAFRRSFDGLTAACNACHTAANHGFIKIRRPNGSPYGNQEFKPGAK